MFHLTITNVYVPSSALITWCTHRLMATAVTSKKCTAEGIEYRRAITFRRKSTGGGSAAETIDKIIRARIGVIFNPATTDLVSLLLQH